MRRFDLRRPAALPSAASKRPALWRVSYQKLPLWQRLVVLALFPFVLAGGASGTYYLRLHRVSHELRLADLPLAPPPAAGRRILVLSPHCDDETLGVGGLIADARRAGADVTVAFLTNGDGFALAAGRALHKMSPAPVDLIRFAEERQDESLAALGELGVGGDHVVFLGYPDRGLAPLWEEHWSAAWPFRSPFTDCACSPYRRVYTPNAVYCGASLLSDLARLLRQTKPTDIYVTHPADDHPDHAAAAAFAQAALLQARDREESWARAVRLRYYIVHRGDWPLPQGMRPDKPLLPPVGLSALDTRWEAYLLSSAARRAKARALDRYGSQMAMTRRFLTSFVRKNEIYGALPELRAGRGVGDAAWRAAPSAPDATRDNLVRYARPSADLRGLSVCQTPGGLHVRVMTRGPISPRVRYTLLLRATGSGGASGPAGVETHCVETHFLALNLQGEAVIGARPGPIVVAVSGNTLEVAVPIAALGLASAPRRVWVAAQTHWARVPVDQTGFRSFSLGADAPQKTAKYNRMRVRLAPRAQGDGNRQGAERGG